MAQKKKRVSQTDRLKERIAILREQVQVERQFTRDTNTEWRAYVKELRADGREAKQAAVVKERERQAELRAKDKERIAALREQVRDLKSAERRLKTLARKAVSLADAVTVVNEVRDDE